MIKLLSGLVGIWMVLSFSAVNAQEGFYSGSAFAIGSGGAGAVHVQGWQAMLYNPAALVHRDGALLKIGVASFGVNGGNSALNLDFYNKYFTGTGNKIINEDGKKIDEPYFITDNDKEDILNLFKPVVTGNGLGSFTPIAASFSNPFIGSIGLSFNIRGDGAFQMSDDYMRFLLYGLQPGDDYKLDDVNIAIQLRNEFVFAYARELFIKHLVPGLDYIAVGANFKIQRGMGYLEMHDVSQRFTSNEETGVITHFITYKGRAAGNDVFASMLDEDIESKGGMMDGGGSGFGFDFGVQTEWFNSIQAYASVLDIGSIQWNQNAVDVTDTRTVEFVGRFRDSDGTQESTFEKDTLSSIYVPVRNEKSFTTSLPTTFNMGIGISHSDLPVIGKYRIIGDLQYFANLSFGLNDAIGNSTTPRFAVGTNWVVFPFWEVRSGLSFGGETGFQWGLGTGFYGKYVAFDIGTSHLHELFSGDSMTRLSLGATLSFNIY